MENIENGEKNYCDLTSISLVSRMAWDYIEYDVPCLYQSVKNLVLQVSGCGNLYFFFFFYHIKYNTEKYITLKHWHSFYQLNMCLEYVVVFSCTFRVFHGLKIMHFSEMVQNGVKITVHNVSVNVLVYRIHSLCVIIL